MTAIAHYCNAIDHRYISRELALYASMRRHCQPFRLWVLCLNDECHAMLSALALSDVVLLRIRDLENHDQELLEAKSTRSEIEYYMTIRAAFMSWLFESRPEIDVLTHIDGDLFFFQRPRVVFEGFQNYSTLIVPHRFTKRNEHGLAAGIYNCGWITFRRDADGLACLRWWRQSSIEWCYDRYEQNRWMEQKYLEQFPKNFAHVQIAQHPGVNVAPWNLDRYRLSCGSGGEPMVDNMPVIFFHFSGLRRVAPFVWSTSHRHFGAPMSRDVRRLLYAPYFADLLAAETIVRGRFQAPLDRFHWRAERVIRQGVYATAREIARLAVRGGGIWLVARHVL